MWFKAHATRLRNARSGTCRGLVLSAGNGVLKKPRRTYRLRHGVEAICTAREYRNDRPERLGAPKPGVQDVTQGIAKEVEPVYRQGKAESGPDGHPRGHYEVVPCRT